MSKYKFIKCKDLDNEFDNSKVIHIIEVSSLPDLLTEIELFLKGAGFNFDGNLDIVKDE